MSDPVSRAVGLIALIILLAIVVVHLGGCGHVPERPPAGVVTQTVYVTVPQPCDPKLSKRPDFPDTRQALQEADDALQRQLLYAGRLARDGYIGELEAAVHACMTPPKPPT